MKNNRREFLKITAGAAIGAWLNAIALYSEAFAAASKSSFPKMLYREYGKTGKKVSILGFGGMRFDPDPVEKGHLEPAAKLVVQAFKYGVNYFDTAPIYVKDKSEEIMGLAFKEIDRIKKNENMDLPYYYTSKSGYRSEKTSDQVLKRLEKTLKRLNKDKLHFYHMWCIMDKNQYKAVMAKGGPYEGAVKAKKEGLIDHIVFSSHASGPETAEMINDQVFEGVLYGYNVINYPRAAEVVKAVKEQDIGFVAMNPLAGGLIPQHKEYFSPKLKHINKDMTLVQSALAFIMGQKNITTALSGISKINELEENISTLKYLKVLDDKRINEIKKELDTRLKDICTNCRYCDVCPMNIPVYEIMNIYNTYILKGKKATQELVEQYKKWGMDVEELIDSCISCKKCEIFCTQKLPILDRFSEFKNNILVSE